LPCSRPSPATLLSSAPQWPCFTRSGRHVLAESGAVRHLLSCTRPLLLLALGRFSVRPSRVSSPPALSLRWCLPAPSAHRWRLASGFVHARCGAAPDRTGPVAAAPATLAETRRPPLAFCPPCWPRTPSMGGARPGCPTTANVSRGPPGAGSSALFVPTFFFFFWAPAFRCGLPARLALRASDNSAPHTPHTSPHTGSAPCVLSSHRVGEGSAVAALHPCLA